GSDDFETNLAAEEVIKEIPHPAVPARLLAALAARLAALEQATAAVAAAKKAKKKAPPPKKGKGGKAPPDPVAQAEEVEREAASGVDNIPQVLAARPDGDPKALAAALLPLVEHKRPEIAGHAVEALGRAAGGSPQVMPTLLGLLTEKSKLANEAFAALKLMSREQRAPALPRLLELAAAPKSRLRTQALMLLPGYLETGVRRGKPGLADALQGKQTGPSEGGAGGLAEIGPAGREFLPLLLDALAQRTVYYGNFSEAFAKIDSEGTYIPRLIELLSAKKSYVRWQAAHCLGNYHDKAKDALPALEALSTDKDWSVRYAVQSAVHLILH